LRKAEQTIEQPKDRQKLKRKSQVFKQRSSLGLILRNMLVGSARLQLEAIAPVCSQDGPDGLFCLAFASLQAELRTEMRSAGCSRRTTKVNKQPTERQESNGESATRKMRKLEKLSSCTGK
jgi:hypothetical protein